METLLIARAPVCISFGGMGNVPGNHKQRDDLVISATISYYVYVILAASQLDGVQLIYADQQALSHSLSYAASNAVSRLALPQVIAHHFKVRDGLTIFIASQIPLDSGLELSGSIAVSMIKALAFCSGLDLEPGQVAELASAIADSESVTRRPDLYAAALGGLNSIKLSKHGVAVEPLCIRPSARQSLEKGLMLFLADGAQHVPEILLAPEQDRQPEREAETCHKDVIQKRMKSIREALERGDLGTFGEQLHCWWLDERKQREYKTVDYWDHCYRLARENGALGGKTGKMGKDGFLVLCCPEAQQTAVVEALQARGLRRWPFTLEDQGVQVMQAVPWS